MARINKENLVNALSIVPEIVGCGLLVIYGEYCTRLFRWGDKAAGLSKDRREKNIRNTELTNSHIRSDFDYVMREFRESSRGIIER